MNQKASKKYEPPKADSGDTAHLVAKAALSVVPGASELFEYFIKPPLEKRLEKWQEEVANALRHLEEENRLNIENLKANEQFISIIVQVTTIALRNHQKEKLSALKNVIINSALQTNINDDLQLIFIRFIDELTPSHLNLLLFFVQNEQALAQLSSYNEYYSARS